MPAPIADLAELLRSLRPELEPGEFAFCVLPSGMAAPPGAIGWFREAEGDTVILPVEDAEALGLAPGFRAAQITLTVHSPLAAVGLTAAVAGSLAGAGISCNVVAACRHDHLFVPADRAAEALEVLGRLQAGAGG